MGRAEGHELVSDLGEYALLERIAARPPGPPEGEIWSGDDAAAVEVPPGRLLLTTDLLVEGIDFDLSYCGGDDLGWKALAVNVSDLAAMGGRPVHALATLALPSDTPVSYVDRVLDGLMDAASSWNVELVGGDICYADRISVGIALTGSAERVVERSTAAPGDSICVTGTLGASRAGLRALRAGLVGPAAERVKRRHLRPHARLAEGGALAELGVTAMIDVSDGLVVDLANLMRASGTGCDVEDLPVDPDVAELFPDDAPDIAALGGEDFELLFTCRDFDVLRGALRARPGLVDVARLGIVTEDEASFRGR